MRFFFEKMIIFVRKYIFEQILTFFRVNTLTFSVEREHALQALKREKKC